MSENQIDCYVIMPFSQTTPQHTEEYWTDHYNDFLKPLIEETEIEQIVLEAHRSKPLRGDILRQIITDLVVSPIVLADLTDKNANVFWELGVRQSFKHGTITIAEYGTRLPFDTSGKGTLFYYPKDHIKMKRFKTQFREAIGDCLSHPDRPDSHVLETLSGRGTLFEIFRRDETIRRLDAVFLECENNLNTLKKISDTARHNQKNKKELQFDARYFSHMAIELLITNRYVDEDKSFFESAITCSAWLDAFNGQLYNWQNDPGIIGKFILNSEKDFLNIIDDFKTKVVKARENVGKLL